MCHSQEINLTERTWSKCGIEHIINAKPVNISSRYNLEPATKIIPNVTFGPDQRCSDSSMNGHIEDKAFFVGKV